MGEQAMKEHGLADKVRRWSVVLKDRASGPLFVGEEVAAVIAKWDTYKNDPAAKGLSASQWCRGWSGFTAGVFTRCAHAMEVLSRGACRSLHHEVAIWITNGAVPAQRIDAVKFALVRECANRGNVPLTRHQARPIVYELIGHVPKAQGGCPTCEVLRQQLRKLGVEADA